MTKWDEIPSKAARPDLIVLDLNMPRMNGREVLAAVKADEQLKTIPVIVFTTSGADSDVLLSYGAHANAYVTKPIDLDAFEQAVDRIRQFYGELVQLPRAV
jgi:CheY-like chemotaxis protein